MKEDPALWKWGVFQDQWPHNLDHVGARGFDHTAMPWLQEAILADRVKWVGPEVFEYLGFRYAITRARDLRGTLACIERTAKLEVDDEGDDVVVDLVAPRHETTYPTWGEF